jgi:hypothetical protein
MILEIRAFNCYTVIAVFARFRDSVWGSGKERRQEKGRMLCIGLRG